MIEITLDDWLSLVERVSDLESSSLSSNALFIPLCIIALVLVVFTLYAVALFIDTHKK